MGEGARVQEAIIDASDSGGRWNARILVRASNIFKLVDLWRRVQITRESAHHRAEQVWSECATRLAIRDVVKVRRQPLVTPPPGFPTILVGSLLTSLVVVTVEGRGEEDGDAVAGGERVDVEVDVERQAH